jgi:hypothetical protein
MKLLHDNMSSVLLTLIDENQMIFRKEIEGIEYLYWYSVQGKGGIEVQDSHHDIDKQHLEYWEECIDNDFRPIALKTEVIMIQENVLAAME